MVLTPTRSAEANSRRTLLRHEKGDPPATAKRRNQRPMRFAIRLDEAWYLLARSRGVQKSFAAVVLIDH